MLWEHEKMTANYVELGTMQQLVKVYNLSKVVEDFQNHDGFR